LRESRRRNRDQIREGLAWLERVAASDDAAAEIVRGSGG
jgi:hypothetical protein